MEPINSTIDPVARIISSVGLGVAIIVGVIHFLTYHRGRWQNPLINIHTPQSDFLLISKSNLLVVKFFVDNPSTLPNTIIGISCKTRLNWFKSSSLKTGNLELIFVDIETSEGKYTSELRLDVAPHIALNDTDWEILLDTKGRPLQDGLWKLPLRLSARSPRGIIIAITSESEQIDKTKEIVLTLKDITHKHHSCALKVMPNK